MGNTISQGHGSRRLTPPAPISIPIAHPVLTPEGKPAPQSLPKASTAPSSPQSPVWLPGREPGTASSLYVPVDAGFDELDKMKAENRFGKFNGYKLMSPMHKEAIRQTEQIFLPNEYGVKRDSREQCVVFHEDRQGKLTAGEVRMGTEQEVYIPKEIDKVSARILVHSHPYLEGDTHYKPSMNDHFLARENGHVDHLIQAPAFDGQRQFLIYSGNVPPRYYFLLENPGNLPVPPKSPDGSMPPFRQRHAAGG